LTLSSKPTALVTGASSGIGEASARRLLTLGFEVYVGARRVEKMAGLAARRAHALALDVADEASVSEAVQRVLAETGRIDVLVNNAGYGSYGSVEDVPLDEARAQLNVNVFGLARLTQLVVPPMRAAGHGRIINISSIGGKFGAPLGAWYHTSKFAVEGFSESLRLELSPFGIDVIVVRPGTIRTEWGGIALDNAASRSAGGPYAPQVASVRRLFATAYKLGTGPEVVARTIAVAATAPRPKLAYDSPLSAAVLLRVLNLMPERARFALSRRLMLPPEA
jgi:NAD(P)-dependent dehydrogenase (short-subunit alcohol dehydrogenase family)